MARIIDDFIKSRYYNGGFGFFEGDNVAAELSITISKNQKRRYKRAQEVPAAFFILSEKNWCYLMRYSKQGECRSINALTEFLHDDSNFSDNSARDAGQYLRKCLLKEALPMLRKSFGDSSSIWKVR